MKRIVLLSFLLISFLSIGQTRRVRNQGALPSARPVAAGDVIESPSAGRLVYYFKTDGSLYTYDGTTETCVSCSTGGGAGVTHKTVIDFDPAVTDYTAIFQTALSIGGSIILEFGKVWPIASTNDPIANNDAVMKADADVIFDLNGGKITSSTTFRLLDIEARNVEIKNGTFESTVDSGADSRDLYGLVTIENDDVDFVKFKNLYFTNPNANTNAIKIIAQAGKTGASNPNTTTGTQIEKLYFENVVCENVGSMGIEIIANSNSFNASNYVNSIYMINCHTKNTGTKDVEGEGISIVASTQHTVIEGGTVDDFGKIGVEISSKNFNIKGMRVTNAKNATDDYFYGLINPGGDGADGYNQYGNKVIENVTIKGTLGKAVFFDNRSATPVKIKNSSILGAVKIIGDFIEFDDCEINTGGNIENNSGSDLTFTNCKINFNNVNRFQLQGTGGVTRVIGCDVTRVNASDGLTNQGQMVFSSGDLKEFISIDSRFDGGYFNTGATGTHSFNFKDTSYETASSAWFAGSAIPTLTWLGKNYFKGNQVNRKGTTANRPIIAQEFDRYFDTQQKIDFIFVDGVWE